MGDMFRFYVTDDFGKVTDKTKLYSPYVSSTKSFENRPYQYLNKTYTDEPKEQSNDYDTDRKVNESFTITNDGNKKISKPKRIGYSGIGKATKDNSIYTLYDTIGNMSEDPDELEENINNYNDLKDISSFYQGLPEFVTKYTDSILNNTSDKIDPKILKSNPYLFKTMPIEIVNALLSGKTINKDTIKELYPEGMLKARYNPTTFTSNKDRDNLYNMAKMNEALNIIDRGLRRGTGKAPVLTLVSVPEDKLVSIKDIKDKDYTVQRDYPEELVAKTITPYRALDRSFINDMFDLYTSDEHKKYLDTIDKTGVQDDIGFFSDLHDELNYDYNNLLKKHGIVADNILSDATKKYIYKDMSNDYNNLCKQRNIIDTLIDVSRW